MNGSAHLFAMNADGPNPVDLSPADTLGDLSPQFSPDGRRIAFSRPGDSGWHPAHLCDELEWNRGDRPAPGVTEPVSSPTFSPDGKRIAFMTDTNPGPGTLYSIAIMNADGTGATDLTPANPEFERGPDFSPDGSKIVFERDEPAAPKLYTINPDGSGLTPLSPPGNVSDSTPAFSPEHTAGLVARSRYHRPTLGHQHLRRRHDARRRDQHHDCRRVSVQAGPPLSRPTGPRSCSPHTREWEWASSSWSAPTAGRCRGYPRSEPRTEAGSTSTGATSDAQRSLATGPEKDRRNERRRM